jgi:hypothetical protein
LDKAKIISIQEDIKSVNKPCSSNDECDATKGLLCQTVSGANICS